MQFTVLTTVFLALLPFVAATPTPTTSHPTLTTRVLAARYSQCVGSTKKIALTFDDGPYIYDGTLKNLLQQYNATATFFVNGNNWECAYDAARVTGMKDLFNAGHEFGSHSWSHPHFPNLTWDQTHNEMYKVEVLLNKTLGVVPALFRAPYGEDQYSLSAIGARNQSSILWNFDSGDSLGHTEAQIKADYTALMNANTNNVIALNHSVQNLTVSTIMPWLLPQLKAKGYQFVTISQCLGIPAYQSRGTPGVRDSTWHC
jgi:peptidoglycan/xylan/chitin deacetylase (PgdA/CDA1 family)